MSDDPKPAGSGGPAGGGASPSTRASTLFPDSALRIPTAGQIIDGKYRVLGDIGEGGMGAVLRAVDLRLGRELAIKLIRPEYLANETVRNAFEAEARMTARIEHPCVVTIHDLGNYGTSPYLVLELVEGKSLAAIMESEREPLAPRRALDFLEAIAEGLDAIHAAGAIHLDIKPENILVTGDGRVKIIDLGIAKIAREQSGRVAGTPGYMSPEAALGESLTPAADVYALGVIAFEMLTRRLPHEGETLEAILTATVGAPIPSMRTFNPKIEEGLDLAVQLGLAKSAMDRPGTASSFVARIRSAVVEAEDAVDPNAPRDASGVSIVVCDDDEDMRGFVVDLLTLSFPGARVLQANNGEAALARAIAVSADLIVSDLMMPRVGGEQLTMTARAHPRTRETPILIVSGVGGAEEWKRLKAHGANAFLVKPFDGDDLVGVVERLLAPRLAALGGASPARATGRPATPRGGVGRRQCLIFFDE